MDDMNVWVKYLANPLVLIGFCFMLLMKFLGVVFKRSNLTIYSGGLIRLFWRTYKWLIYLSVLIIILGFALSFYNASSKESFNNTSEKQKDISQNTKGDQSPAVTADGDVSITYQFQEEIKFLEDLNRLRENNFNSVPKTSGDLDKIFKKPENSYFMDNFVMSERYTTYRIKRANLPQSLKQDILNVLKLFDEKEFHKAEIARTELSESNQFSLQFKNDFATAIYLAEHDYHSALESIIKKYKSLPLNDIRYRWEIAYVIYYFRRDLGLAQCEKSIMELQLKYKRKDISYVWMAIHPPAFYRLLGRDLNPGTMLNNKQLNILKYVVTAYPDDYFIDHALYFLHEYDQIIDKYPESIILDRAYYSKAYLKYLNLMEHDKINLNKKILLEIASDFLKFIKYYPINDLTDQAFSKLSTCYRLLPDSEEAFHKIMEIHEYILKMEAPGMSEDKRHRYLSNVNYSVYNIFSSINSLYSEKFIKVLSSNPQYNLDLDLLKLYIARRAFYEFNYERAYRFYSDIPTEMTVDGSGEKLRIKALKRINGISADSESKEYIWNVALALKSTKYNADHAIIYFDKYEVSFATAEEKPKILLLKGFCYRDMSNGEKMIEQYKELLDKYPNHDLADDALAELGVYYLLWGWRDQHEVARKIFRQVIKTYPNRNSVDNCHNWIAWSYMKQHDYHNAVRKYQENARLFPFTRFARYASSNLKALEIKGYGKHN
ncbi:MAG: tetratricopeptide repeat protein [Calditrichaeota bacterium]|nr:tetratricopeptide repeat protein [Calditrichota bacterium]